MNVLKNQLISGPEHFVNILKGFATNLSTTSILSGSTKCQPLNAEQQTSNKDEIYSSIPTEACYHFEMYAFLRAIVRNENDIKIYAEHKPIGKRKGQKKRVDLYVSNSVHYSIKLAAGISSTCAISKAE